MTNLSRALRALFAGIIAAALLHPGARASWAAQSRGLGGRPGRGSVRIAPNQGFKTPGVSVPGIQMPKTVVPQDLGTGARGLPLAEQSLAAATPKPSERVAEISAAIEPHIQAAVEPSSSDDSASSAGRVISDVVEGRSSAPGAGEVRFSAPEAGSSGAGVGLSKRSPSGPKRGPGAAASPAKSEPPSIDGSFSYEARRWALKAIASVTGTVHSLPRAGERLYAGVLEKLSGKNAVFSDIDRTMAPTAGKVPDKVAAGIVAVRKAGKREAFISDRPALKAGPGDVTGHETISSIAPADRAGIVVAGKDDGIIFEYDGKGEPRVLFEEPPFTEAEKAGIGAAMEATSAKLSSLGTGLVRLDLSGLTYAMLITPGTPAETVIKVSKVLEAELRKLKISYAVEPRVPKDPADPAYVVLAKIDKTVLVRKIAEYWGVKPEESAVLGDSFYSPGAVSTGRLSGLMRRLAELISGSPAPPTGNNTDGGIEGGLPGALTVSFGGTMDPGIRNGYVAPGLWEEEAPRALAAIASKPASRAQDGEAPWEKTLTVVAVILFFAGGIFGWWMLIHSFTELAWQMEQQLYNIPWDQNFPF